MPSKHLTEQILSFVQADGYKPREVEQLALAMGMGHDEQGDFHDACRALMKSGRIALGSSNAVMMSAPPGKLTGIFRGNKRGFGFVIARIAGDEVGAAHPEELFADS